MKILKNVDVVVEITPEELAAVFADLNFEGKAKFFNELFRKADNNWYGEPKEFFKHVAENHEITPKGIAIMEAIGEGVKMREPF
jgi:F0F1-type ATP synthase delta subunit